MLQWSPMIKGPPLASNITKGPIHVFLPTIKFLGSYMYADLYMLEPGPKPNFLARSHRVLSPSDHSKHGKSRDHFLLKSIEIFKQVLRHILFMAYHFPNYPAAGFKEDLGFQGELNNQISKCREALNDGDIARIKNSSETLSFVLITPEIKDDIYIKTLEQIEEELNGYREVENKKYKERLKRAFNKSVVEPPGEFAPLWYYQLRIKAAIALFERKKLLLNKKTFDKW
jgi:hypothetical protein